jgi:RND family efflux transporter MFP subunit
VRKGQLIARIDAGEYAAQYAQSQTALAIAEEQEKLARRHWDDLKPEERAQYTLESEKVRSVVAESSAYLKRSYVLAPFDGVISSKFVSDGTTVAPGAPIVRVIGDMEKKELVFDVPIDVGRGISVDTVIDIVYGNDTETAVVYAIDPVADEQTRKITIHAYLSEQSQITIGAFVDVHISVNVDDGGYVLPYAAVVRQYDDTFVYTVVDDIAYMRKINVVATMRDHAVVHGVQDNDVVVVHNAHAITDGDRVHIVTGDK